MQYNCIQKHYSEWENMGGLHMEDICLNPMFNFCLFVCCKGLDNFDLQFQVLHFSSKLFRIFVLRQGDM